MPDELHILEPILVAIAGLLFGSFATALTYRIPRDIPWIYDRNKGPSRSACTHCGAVLQMRDLVPLFSWVFMRGRCRRCKTKISLVYPASEALTMTGFLVVYYFAGVELYAIPFYLLVPVLVSLIFIDLEHYILPNELVAIAGILGAINLYDIYSKYIKTPNIPSAEEFVTIEYILGGMVFYGALSWALGFIMSKALKKEAMGFGDVKLFAVIGLWLGMSKIHLFLMLSGILGVIFAIVWRLAGKGAVFPFGPSLICAFFILLFFNGSLL